MAMAMAVGRFRTSLILTFLLTLVLLPAPCTSVDGRIKNLVFLVMENRSFDHMLGWMKRLNPQIDGVTGQESNAISTADPKSSRVFFDDEAEYVDPNPGHSFEAIREQVFGSNNTSADPPPMNGFVQQAASMTPNMSELVMKGFKPESVPVYRALAQDFAIFNRWFSALPGPTQPNRLFVYSATSHGATYHDKKQMAEGYPQRTIFQSLEESGLSFGIYHHGLPATLFYRELRKVKYVSKFHKFENKFQQDASDGSLPHVVVIEPRYFHLLSAPANDDHPSHDVSNGQKFVKRVYEILRGSPQWNQTLLVITYDEHGGFYDHVPTPARNVPSPDGILGSSPFFFKFDRLGVRVPTILVSPWIKKGTVVNRPSGPYPSSEFEHSSIPATIKKMLNLSADFLTKRDAWAGTFEGVVSLDSPRTDCPEVLPDVPEMTAERQREMAGREEEKLSEFQREIVELAGALNGDYTVNNFEQIIAGMKAKEAQQYVETAMARFTQASRDALKLGASGNSIVSLKPSFTATKTKGITNQINDDL